MGLARARSSRRCWFDPSARALLLVVLVPVAFGGLKRFYRGYEYDSEVGGHADARARMDGDSAVDSR